MTSIHSEIKGIKKEVRDQYANSADNSKSNSDSGWKELLASVNNNPYQYRRIKQATKEKYFNSNAKIIEDPLEESAFNYRICNSCGAPLALNSIMDHLENHCKGNNGADSAKEMKREPTDDEFESMSSVEKKNPDSSASNGKRLATDEGSYTPGPDQKKLKESSETPLKRQRKVKQRNPTDKHLIDFNKQCGVELPEGGYCARSLTCKSHSMGAKRSVVGRTQPFDSLLADYHKQHQTKIGAAAEKRAKQQEIQKQQKQVQREQKKQSQQNKQSQKNRKGNSAGPGGSSKSANGASSKNGTDALGSDMSLTPEEETTQVLNGVSRSFPLPLESTVLSSVRGRTKYFRMREMFASAFSVKPGYTPPGYGAIHSRVGCLDLDRTTDYKLRIRTPQPINQLPPQGLTPEQLQKLQQQRLLRAQMQRDNQQQNNYQQQHHQAPIPQHQQTSMPYNHVAVPRAMDSMSKPPQGQISHEQNGLTPQEIQFQQQKLRQQQLQQQRFEAAAFHLANATKLMQGSNGDGSPGNPETPNNVANSPPSMGAPSQTMGSPMGGRVNVGIGNYGGRVN